MQSTFRFAISAAIFLMLSACASLPDDKNLQNHAQSVAGASTLSSASFLQRAKLKLQKGKSEALSLYAPSYFENAQNAYQEAREAYQDKDSEDDIKEQTQLSIEYIDSGLRNKKVVKDTLKKSLKHRQLLITLKANKHFPQEFSVIEEHFLDLVKSIEQRKLDAALTAQRDVLKEMSALEVKTIGFTHLSKAEEMLAKAQQQDAQQLLPITYQKTINKLEVTRLFIGKNPRKKSQIRKLTKSALFTSQRLFYLARQAKRLEDMETNKIEKYVLSRAEQLQRINTAAKQADVGNLSFNDQSLILAEQIKKQNTKNKRSQKEVKTITPKELDKWKRKVVLLQREVKRLRKKLK